MQSTSGAGTWDPRTAAPTAPTAVLAAARDLPAADLHTSPLAQLADDLRVLQQLRNVVDGEFLRRLGEFDARAGAAAGDHLSTQSWLRAQCLLSPAAAHGRLAIARRLRRAGLDTLDGAIDGADATPDAAATAEPPSLAAALTAGSLSYEHAVVIARALDKLPLAAQAPAESLLVTTATTVDAGTLRQVAERIREAVAPETLVEEEQSAYDRRFLNVSETIDRMVAIDGLLDPETGAAVMAAVHALATPAGSDDDRTAGQRRADALGEVVEAGLRTGDLPETGGERPAITLVMDVEPFLPGGHGIAIARTPTGAVLAGAAVERILCDSGIVRVLTLGKSQILDAGRKVRLATPAMRRALTVRDGGCVGYECDRPPAWTDVHHVIPVSQGGRTDLDWLLLACRRHHILVHKRGWVCVREGAGWQILPPHLAEGYPPEDRVQLNPHASPDCTALPPTVSGGGAHTTRGSDRQSRRAGPARSRADRRVDGRVGTASRSRVVPAAPP